METAVIYIRKSKNRDNIGLLIQLLNYYIHPFRFALTVTFNFVEKYRFKWNNCQLLIGSAAKSTEEVRSEKSEQRTVTVRSSVDLGSADLISKAYSNQCLGSKPWRVSCRVSKSLVESLKSLLRRYSWSWAFEGKLEHSRVYSISRNSDKTASVYLSQIIKI